LKNVIQNINQKPKGNIWMHFCNRK
jgi:hypothetical protein